MGFPGQTAALAGYNQVHNGFSSPEARSLPGGDSAGSGRWRTPQIPRGDSGHRPPEPLSQPLFCTWCPQWDKVWWTAPAWTSTARCPWAASTPRWRASRALASHCWGKRTSPQLPVSYPSLLPAPKREGQSSRLVQGGSAELLSPGWGKRGQKSRAIWNHSEEDNSCGLFM